MPPAPADELIDAGFRVEVADAPLLHEGLNLADLAHVLVLLEGRIIPEAAARRLLGVLLETHAVPAERFPYDPAYGELYNCRERVFSERLGDDAGWLHAARPRREAVRVALRVRLRRDLIDLLAAAAGFVEAVSALASLHAETFMADQTYLQQAQPSTFGHYLLSFAYPALRDVDRLSSELDWVNRSPGGAGCVNGSRLLSDRARFAELLGFDSVIEHTRDAMWQVDGLLGMASAAAGLVTGLSKLAEDLEIWSSQEFDYVTLADGYTRASVLMPQKRNPYALSIVRGEAGVLIGRLAGLFAISKSPSARSDNLIFAYGEVPRALGLARKATELMRGVVATLTVHAERMDASLRAGFSQATDLAEWVMQTCAVDYRTAYRLVGTTVRRAAAEGLRGVDVTAEMLDEAAVAETGAPLGLAGRDLSRVLDPREIVSTRDLDGGAAPHIVKGMAARCVETARDSAGRAEGQRGRIDAAESGLLGLAREVAGA
jgi:argininosuccinate lyase